MTNVVAEDYFQLAGTGQYGGGCYYSPLFRWLFYPFFLLDRVAGALAWEAVLAAALFYALRATWHDVPSKSWRAAIAVPAVVFFVTFDAEVLLFAGAVFLLRRAPRAGWREGLLFGFLLFNPVFILLLPYLLWSAPKSRRLAFLLGAVPTFVLNWIWMVLDPALLANYVTSLLAGSMTNDHWQQAAHYMLWSWAIYPWFNYAHHAFWVARPRAAARAAYLSAWAEKEGIKLTRAA